MDDIADPDFKLDELGVCNYCHFAASQVNARRIMRDVRPWLIHEIQQAGQGKKYDCLIGLSGGVDSSYALHLLVESGLRPLTFQVDNGWNTPEADENIMRLVEGLKVPLYRYTIDLKKFKELQRSFIMSGTANVEIPTDHILMAATYDMARKYNIKTVISGGNWQTEGTMPAAFGYQARDLLFIKAVYKQFIHKQLTGLPTISLFQYLYCRFILGIKVVNLLDYYEYNRTRAIKTLEKEYGYKPYGEKHAESTFTKWFQNVYLPERFGIDKRKPHLSSLIHSGQMTREQAMQELAKPPENIENEATAFLHQFPKKTYKDYPNSEKWWNLLTRLYAYLPRKN